MTDKLALLDDASDLESLLAVLDEEDDADEDEGRPGWTHPFPSERRWRILQFLMPVEDGPTYTHVVNGYFQPVLSVSAKPLFVPGSEPVVAALRSYVVDHYGDGEYRPMSEEESYDIEVILASSPLTEGLTLDWERPNLPQAGWLYVNISGSPEPGTWLAEHGPWDDGGQWPEYSILVWEPMP
jgi:hypothetical protein